MLGESFPLPEYRSKLEVKPAVAKRANLVLCICAARPRQSGAYLT
jgi:hypothetical protein